MQPGTLTSKTAIGGIITILSGIAMFHVNPVAGIQTILGGVMAIFARDAIQKVINPPDPNAPKG